MRLTTLAFFLLLALFSSAQILTPVKWEFCTEKVDAETYNLKATATIKDGWYIYSQFLENDEGPLPTFFEFNKDKKVSFVGKVKEDGNIKKEYDKNFEMDLIKISKKATFTQVIKVSETTPEVTGFLSFMTCDPKRCLPPEDVEFAFRLNEFCDGTTAIVKKEPVKTTTKPPATKTPPAIVTKTTEATKAQTVKVEPEVQVVKAEPIKIITEEKKPASKAKTVVNTKKEEPKAKTAVAEETTEPSPVDGTEEISADDAEKDANSKKNLQAILDNDTKISDPNSPVSRPSLDKSRILNSCEDGSTVAVAGEETEKKRSFWTIFLLGFGGGLFALLTPCVFPLIPVTVSYFTKNESRSKGIRDAIIYGLSIVGIYVGLGMLITVLWGSSGLNFLSTHWIPNLLFFAVFVFFAFALFGYFELTMPSWLVNKSDKQADRGGLIGIFFMAATLALVSFSCTGPIIGPLLVQLANAGMAGPFFGMLGFSLALALPFTLFAIFPQWLNSLPQSGGWLNSVKVVLGFVELALAVKFLSIADMTEGWGILPIEIFLAAWILIALGLAAYLFGFIKFPHDSPLKKINPMRFGFGLASVAFAVYLATGFNYKPLKLLSGLAPPTHYRLFNKIEDNKNVDGDKIVASKKGCPANLACFKDYEEGLAYAKQENKMVLVDFTGYGCVNCRKMEENVWTDKTVNDFMQDKLVVISLYVDEKKKLPKEDQYYTESMGKRQKVRRIGGKWSDFQATHFLANSQPYYVLMSPDEKVLNSPANYMSHGTSEKFMDFLNCGLNQLQDVCSTCQM